MKNIVVLNGAARKNGNTAQLLAAFIDGAQSAGHSIESFHLQSMNIHGCTGCNSCQNAAKNLDNPCVQNDDMANVYPAVNKADLVVFVSPYYFWGITGPLKTTVDRLYALVNQRGAEGFKGECVLLMTAGATDYSKAVDWYGGFESYMGWKNKGMVLGSGKIEEARKLGESI